MVTVGSEGDSARLVEREDLAADVYADVGRAWPASAAAMGWTSMAT
jgi:hypothetical protein